MSVASSRLVADTEAPASIRLMMTRSWMAMALAVVVAGCSGPAENRARKPEASQGAGTAGLIFVNEAGFNDRIKARINTLVLELARRTFTGASSTVHGKVYAQDEARVDLHDSTGNFLLVLPYGDREISEWNDNAAVYLLSLLPIGSNVSSSFRISVGQEREVVVLAFDLDPTRAAEVLGCLRDNAGGMEYFRLRTFNGQFRSVPVGRSSRACPPGEVLP